MPTLDEIGVDASRLAALRSTAERARDTNYSPYSGFAVVAAVETPVGVFGGSNVENANFTLTKHAEEAAILAAIHGGAGPAGPWLQVLYVVGGAPCGSCRQFAHEFASPNTLVLIERDDTPEPEAWLLKDLLPRPFGPEDLGVAR